MKRLGTASRLCLSSCRKQVSIVPCQYLTTEPNKPLEPRITSDKTNFAKTATNSAPPPPHQQARPGPPSTKSPVRKAFSILAKLLAVGGVAGVAYFIYQETRDPSKTGITPPETKKKLIVLGTGWAAINLLKTVDANLYDITIVSPTNYFLFTPLLPSAIVGTLEPTHLLEPVRPFLKNKPTIKFYEASCDSIDPVSKTIHCVDESPIAVKDHSFTLSYDHLILAVGSHTNTFNTPGVNEHCYFIKSIDQVSALKNHILDCIETASLPEIPDAERKRLLTFVVVGGGPTGVETAAEIHDFLREDLVKLYPDAIPDVDITLVQSADHLLNTYSEEIAIATSEHFARNKINVIYNSRVTDIQADSLAVFEKASKKEYRIPYGTCVWSTGIAPAPLVKDLIKKLPEHQTNRNAVITDRYLRVVGAPDIFAMGDCSTIRQDKLITKFEELFKLADTNSDGVLSFAELDSFAAPLVKEYPQWSMYLKTMRALFTKYDTDASNDLSLNEFKQLLLEVDSKLTALPPTAQAATQQGEYLAKLLNHVVYKPDYDNTDNDIYKPFTYHHAGSFAYIGANTSVVDIGKYHWSGLGAWLLWRSAYWSKQYSLRNKVALCIDWAKVSIFGRDTSRV